MDEAELSSFSFNGMEVEGKYPCKESKSQEDFGGY